MILPRTNTRRQRSRGVSPEQAPDAPTNHGANTDCGDGARQRTRPVPSEHRQTAPGHGGGSMVQQIMHARLEAMAQLRADDSPRLARAGNPPALDANAAVHHGLPVARLRSPASSSTTYYAVSSIDVNGRLGDRSPLQTLGWGPGHPVAVSLASGTIVVASQPRSRVTVTRQGHLRLPTSVRRACRLEPGDRLLLAAYPDRDLLVAYTASTLDHMLLTYHSTVPLEVSR